VIVLLELQRFLIADSRLESGAYVVCCEREVGRKSAFAIGVGLVVENLW